jgi:hypothetical protein
VTLTFSPTAKRSSTGTFSVTTTGGNGSVSLSGTGI